MKFRELRKKVINALERGELDEIVRLAEDNIRTVSVLINQSYDKTSVITWRAIIALSKVVDRITERSLEEGRNIARRLLWSITEESGGLGWSAIEMLAEIIRKRPKEYGDIAYLLPEYFEEEVFQPGVLYAMCRIGSLYPDLIEDKNTLINMIKEALRSHLPEVRGQAVITINCLQGILPKDEFMEDLRRLSHDSEKISVYEEDSMRQYRVSELTGKILTHA